MEFSAVCSVLWSSAVVLVVFVLVFASRPVIPVILTHSCDMARQAENIPSSVCLYV